MKYLVMDNILDDLPSNDYDDIRNKVNDQV